jgi:hypothetical protein
VAIIPFFVSPLGMVLVMARLVVLRTRSVLLESLLAISGLALPWLYFLVR